MQLQMEMNIPVQIQQPANQSAIARMRKRKTSVCNFRCFKKKLLGFAGAILPYRYSVLGWTPQVVEDCLQQRLVILMTAAGALRSSASLRCLLHAVACLGSWINSADACANTGFSLSSSLGKLRHFRALRGHREVSLLHVHAAPPQKRSEPLVNLCEETCKHIEK